MYSARWEGGVEEFSRSLGTVKEKRKGLLYRTNDETEGERGRDDNSMVDLERQERERYPSVEH